MVKQTRQEPDAVKRAALIEAEEEFITTSLITAADDNYAGMKILLQNEAALERLHGFQHPFWGGNALHMAASNGSQRAIFALLEAKFDPNVKDRYGRNAFECAKRCSNEKTLQILQGRIRDMPAKTWMEECYEEQKKAEQEELKS